MNGTYYKNPTFPSIKDNNYQDSIIVDSNTNEKNEDIISNNIGKLVFVFASFPNSNEIKDITFEGIIENTKKDYLILSNPQSGKWYLIPYKNINYIEFEENINI